MKRIFFVLAAILGLMLMSCGGDGPVTKMDLTLTDFQFSPNTFTVSAGQEITFNSQNNGAVVHNFVIMNLGKDVGESLDESDSADVYWQIELQPAGEVNTTFTAPSEPGEYQIICSVEGHLMAGMVGKLIVVSGE
jgi:uncharacterized cupredoxin-like copper-binding protein